MSRRDEQMPVGVRRVDPDDDSLGAPGRRSTVRDRTRARLLQHAGQLMRLGQMPSLLDVARDAGVSRATAYRYFPSRSHLISAVVADALGPVRSFEPTSSEGRERIRELFDKTFPRFTGFETQLRAAMVLALEHQWRERAGTLEEEPFRRGHRVAILRRVAAPLRPQLGARGFERLLKALSLVYGIESWVVLKDIWHCRDREVEAVSRWMIEALVDRAITDGLGAGSAGPRSVRSGSLRSGSVGAASRSAGSRVRDAAVGQRRGQAKRSPTRRPSS